MHLQWKRKTLSTAGGKGRPCLVAVLITGLSANGVDAETPIGSVELRYLDTRATCTRDFHHGLFWMKVERALENLGLEPERRRKIEDEIAEKVPRPTSEWALWGVTCIPRFD